MITVKEMILSYDRCSFYDVIEKFGDLEIVKKVDGRKSEFPQSSFNYRNVMVWYLLSDGSAIGFNESPRSGWSFPRVGKKTVSKFYPDTSKLVELKYEWN